MDHGLTLIPAASPADFAEAKRLFLDYATSLGVSLSSQGFDEELATLPGKYAAPAGVLLLARNGEATRGVVGVRPLAPGICEMKRLYAVPAARGTGLGRRLAEAAIGFARDAGYRALRLDTLPSMAAASALYRTLGFREIPAYYDNSAIASRCFELALDRGGAQTRA
jgi:putative acetyltransferase